MRHPLLCLLVSAFALTAFNTTFAASKSTSLTGKNLVDSCKIAIKVLDGDHKLFQDKKSSNDAMFCLGVVDGFSAGHMASSVITYMNKHGTYKGILMKKHGILFCPPRGSTNEQKARIIVKYFDKHPDLLKKAYEVGVYRALKQAYPCAHHKSKRF